MTMEDILRIAGLALTSALSFTLALLLGWSALAGLLRLLPASAPAEKMLARPAIQNVMHIREAAAVPAASRGGQRVRVVVTNARNRSGKIYAVRTA
jgi:hypothetical protein